MQKTLIKKKFLGLVYNPFNGQYEDSFEEVEEVVDVAPTVHKKEIFYSDKKAIVSGDIIEIINYEYGNCYNFEGVATGKKSSGNKKLEYNVDRVKKKLRRLINSNVTGNDLFVTLTYADNMCDVDKGKKDFKVFIKAMKRKGFNLKYVYVVEFQKRGAVHFHVILFGCGYIDSNFLSDVWKKGFVKINRINDVDNVGSYVVKYMGKDIIDDRLVGKDLYGRSRGLKESVEINNPQEVCQLLEANIDNIVYTNTYNTDYKGNISYCQINKKRNKEVNL